MDTTNQSDPNQKPVIDTQKYQEILDKYSQQLASQPQQPQENAPPPPLPQQPPASDSDPLNDSPQDLILEPSVPPTQNPPSTSDLPPLPDLSDIGLAMPSAEVPPDPGLQTELPDNSADETPFQTLTEPVSVPGPPSPLDSLPPLPSMESELTPPSVEPEDLPAAAVEDIASPNPQPAPPSLPQIEAPPIAAVLPPVAPTTASPSSSGPSKAVKIIFFVSFILFAGVSLALGYTLYKKSTLTPSSNVQPLVNESESSNSDPAENSTATGQCQLNEEKYDVGQAFPAADGCNTCTCQEDLTLTCTQNDCFSETPDTGQKSSLKNYKSSKYAFSLDYPADYKAVGTTEDMKFSKDEGGENYESFVFLVKPKTDLSSYLKELENTTIDTEIRQSEVVLGSQKFVKLEYTNGVGEMVEYILQKDVNLIIFSDNREILSTYKTL